MRRIIFLSLFIFIVSNIYSQIEKPIKKGNLLIGSSLGSSTFDFYYIDVSITPSAGYFVINNFAIGGIIQSQYYKDYYDGINIGLGPFLKYYSNIGIYVAFKSLYGKSFIKYSGTNYKSSYFFINPEIGYSHFINQNISLELGLNYNYRKQINTYEKSFLNLNLGFNIFL